MPTRSAHGENKFGRNNCFPGPGRDDKVQIALPPDQSSAAAGRNDRKPNTLLDPGKAVRVSWAKRHCDRAKMPVLPRFGCRGREAAVVQKRDRLLDRDGVARQPGMGRLDDDVVGHPGQLRARN